MMCVLIMPIKLINDILPACASNHGGRVVKALDLRSNGHMSAWVRTPPVVDFYIRGGGRSNGRTGGSTVMKLSIHNSMLDVANWIQG